MLHTTKLIPFRGRGAGHSGRRRGVNHPESLARRVFDDAVGRACTPGFRRPVAPKVRTERNGTASNVLLRPMTMTTTTTHDEVHGDEDYYYYYKVAS